MNAALYHISGSDSVKQAIRTDRPLCLTRFAEGARFHALRLAAEVRDVIAVYGTDYAAKKAYDAYIYPKKTYLPSPHAELRVVDTAENAAEVTRSAALMNIKRGGVLFTSFDGLLHKMRAPEAFYSGCFDIKAGDVLPPTELMDRLAALGYRREEMIASAGEMSGRGDIAEVFVPGSHDPIRINYFDDEIESIKYFDADSQRSFGSELESFTIAPARELALSAAEDAEVRGAIAAAGKIGEELAARPNIPNLPAYTGGLSSPAFIADYLKDALIYFEDYTSLLAEHKKREDSRLKLFGDALHEGEAVGIEPGCRFAPEELEQKLGALWDAAVLDGYPFKNRLEIDMNIRAAVGFAKVEDAVSAATERAKAGGKVYIYAGPGARELSKAFLDQGMTVPIEDRPLEQAGIAISPARLISGFEVGNALFLSETDVFGAPRRGKAKKAKKQKTDILRDLSVGDIVVHEVHGKGRYLGLKQINIDGRMSECMEIEYRDGDKLYINTAQIDRVEKYIGQEEETPSLSKLGGKEWDGMKSRARKSVKKLAEDLAAIYAERAESVGYTFSPDSVWQREFEDAFPYEETEGQAESLAEIKRDMESPRIMDRLLMGDVGYGKTEVAMRACMKAVLDSKQCAVLVPTTLLARQHTKTFRERFAGFPVRIEELSRHTKKPTAVLEGVKNGSIDIIIGTHKLLSKKVEYKDLGLLVIDEEQRFGVSHKERIKDMRRDVDVLTLTATPIPRTLEMAMSGIRDMSTIDTPPEDRKETRAYVAEFSWPLVREAVLRELERGGQIYFVTRRISEMDHLLAEIKKRIPEARAAIAHGQMSEEEFSRVTGEFYEHSFDLLLCTTIIESGIDIPNVNTVIVYEADMFGLAQLYQIKGRVGRSSKQAYAYFTYRSRDTMSETAAKRLAAIREFTQFGSGMKIAMRDLEIRGAGNVLGAEQSGHMAQIGYGLYCKIVRQEVLKAMGKETKEKRDCTVELMQSALLADSYIPDGAAKLDMYRRVASIETTADAKDVKAELIDRFGPLPRQAETLILTALISAYGARAGMSSIVLKKQWFEMKFFEDVEIDVEKLARVMKAYKGSAELRRSSPPAVLFGTGGTRIYQRLIGLLDEIGRCIVK